MPRLGLSGLRDRHRAARAENDMFPLFAKAAGVLVVAGLVAGFLLVSGGDGDDEVAVTNPPVPTISDAGGAEPEQATPPPRPEVVVPAPAVGTQTAAITPKTKAKPKPRPRPTIVRPGRTQFERPGGKCADAGAFALTRRFEPLVCRGGRWDRWP